MNVTVGTTSPDFGGTGASALGQSTLNARCISAHRPRGPVCAVMAFTAQEGRATLEQCVDVGAVRGVAMRASLGHRLMLKEHRTAFFSMTGLTGFVDGVLFQEFLTRGSMRVVTVRTDHFALIDRVMRNLPGIRSLLFVTGVANLRLRFL